MNELLLKRIALYGVGAILGGGVGYVVTDHVLTLLEYGEFNKIISELDKEHAIGILDKEEYRKEVKEEWTPEAAKPLPRKPRKKNAENPSTDYTKFANKRTPEEEVRARIINEGKAAVSPDEPHVITMEEHSLDDYPHENRVWTYYEGDGEVTDENEALVTAPEDSIGDALQHFGEGSGDPDTVYVRNVKLATDYEIVRLHTSYSKKVLGQKEPDAKKDRKHNTRKVDKLDEEEDA